MLPFKPRHDWYEKYWYSPQPVKKLFRITPVVAGLAALALAVLLR